MAEQEGWIGFDLDGCIAKYDHWEGIEHIGDPIPSMILKIKGWLDKGYEVRIVTARVNPNQDRGSVDTARYWIEKWCLAHIGVELPVTYGKDYSMIFLYDDRAKQVRPNCGITVEEELEDLIYCVKGLEETNRSQSKKIKDLESDLAKANHRIDAAGSDVNYLSSRFSE